MEGSELEVLRGMDARAWAITRQVAAEVTRWAGRCGAGGLAQPCSHCMRTAVQLCTIGPGKTMQLSHHFGPALRHTPHASLCAGARRGRPRGCSTAAAGGPRLCGACGGARQPARHIHGLCLAAQRRRGRRCRAGVTQAGGSTEATAWGGRRVLRSPKALSHALGQLLIARLCAGFAAVLPSPFPPPRVLSAARRCRASVCGARRRSANSTVLPTGGGPPSRTAERPTALQSKQPPAPQASL